MSKLVRFDWAIKYLLRNKADFVVLEGFLSELIGEKIIIEEVLESETNKNSSNDKSGRADLLVKTSNKERVIIEIQCYKERDFLSRILYGTSKVITETITQGQKYIEVAKVISINIAYFHLGEGSDYIYKGKTCFKGIHSHDVLHLNKYEKKLYATKRINSPEEIFPEYYLIRVDIFNDTVKNKLDEWMYFFKNSEIKKEFKAQGIKEASERLAVLRLTEKQRSEYENYCKNFSIESSIFDTNAAENEEKGIKKGLEQGLKQGLEQGLKQGLEQGLEHGKYKKSIEIAKKLIKKKMKFAEISEITGLSVTEIKTIKNYLLKKQKS